jgi:hypothetical protein
MGLFPQNALGTHGLLLVSGRQGHTSGAWQSVPSIPPPSDTRASDAGAYMLHAFKMAIKGAGVRSHIPTKMPHFRCTQPPFRDAPGR